MYFWALKYKKLLPKQSIKDLEFDLVLQQLAQLCVTMPGKEYALKLQPSTDFDFVETALLRTNEFRASFSRETRIPNHGFQSVAKALSFLKIENSRLDIEGFRNIKHLVDTCLLLQKFFKKHQELYPKLYALVLPIEVDKEVSKAIDDVIDRFGEIKNNASDELRIIRREIEAIKGKIGQSFGAALSRYQASGFLDEIKESVLDNRRVLAVKAMYRKKVKGVVMGSSKTGSIVYVEPDATQKLNRNLQNLLFEEQEEIQRILLTLSHFVRPYNVALAAQEAYLTELDLIAAKATYGKNIQGCMPKLVKEKEVEWIKAYHPLLYLSNKSKGETTVPQTIGLHQQNRIIVISGPNAGGKSITLKTVGLLQLMLQSGMQVPVHESSRSCVFKKILTDIGDNQSIENHLSTYSYRLKNMNRFLKKCNKNTLFLIDEFGTGSDPELGGALAEIFLEVFHEQEAFGIITTHYSNLKLLAEETPNMTNANMQFDNRNLQPTYQLTLGEAGSSFTFEVAQKNGIPFSLINRAKKKIESGKVRFDASIAKMQKERSRLTKTSEALKIEEQKAARSSAEMENLNLKLKDKLLNYQEMYDAHQRMIVLGNKLNELAEEYYLHGKKRNLVSALLQIVETENAKRKVTDAKKIKAARAQKKALTEVFHKEVEKIRVEKKKQEAKPLPPKPRPEFKLGDQVRMTDGKAVGTIDVIEKKRAVVNYGLFTTQVSLDALELVSAKK